MTKRHYSVPHGNERTRAMGSSDSPTPASENYLKVSRADDAVLIQVHGLGNMYLAPTLQSFVESEINSGFVSFVVDLKNCQGLDSTFMGTFTGLSVMLKNKFGWFCLVNVSEDNRRLLKMLGIINLVSIHPGDFPVAKGETTTLNPTNDPYLRQKQIHAAHRNLIEADPANQERFGPFIKAMEEEMLSMPRILPPKSRSQDNPDTKQ